MIVASIVDSWRFVRLDDGELTTQSNVGGLFSALNPVLKQRSGTWISATMGDDLDGSMFENGAAYLSPDIEPVGEVQLCRLSLESVDRQSYFEYIDRVLWPLFHSLPAYSVDLSNEVVYQQVNRRFAESAVAIDRNCGSNSYWIHDFQLMCVPAYIREERPDATIVYFHHIPIPDKRAFNEIDWSAFIHGVTAADVIGVHTETDARNLLRLAELYGYEVIPEKRLIVCEEWTTMVAVHPVGVDTDRVRKSCQSESQILSNDTKTYLIGVDRMDYTKGIVNKLLGFETFLERYPSRQCDVVLYQSLSVEKAEKYPEYGFEYEAVKRIAGEINDRFGGPTHNPVLLDSERLTLEELSALYRRADVALVTPIADGMNLVAKEFVVAQSLRENATGALVLSQQAGVAEEFTEAIIVEPTPNEIAAAIHEALALSPFNKRQRMDSMFETVMARDNKWWIDQQLSLFEER